MTPKNPAPIIYVVLVARRALFAHLSDVDMSSVMVEVRVFVKIHAEEV